MASHFLCGFLSDEQILPELLLKQDRVHPLHWQEAEAFENEKDFLASLRLPEGWRSDFFLLRLGLAPVPPWVWSLSLPIVALVEDLDSLWHHHRLCLPYCDLAFADPESATCLQRAGATNVRAFEGMMGLWTAEMGGQAREGGPCPSVVLPREQGRGEVAESLNEGHIVWERLLGVVDKELVKLAAGSGDPRRALGSARAGECRPARS
jgi:hypothetical protein